MKEKYKTFSKSLLIASLVRSGRATRAVTWKPLFPIFGPFARATTIHSPSGRLLTCFTWTEASLEGFKAMLSLRRPVPTAALVTRTTRWPRLLSFMIVSTIIDKLPKSGKWVFSSQMDEVPTLMTKVSEDLVGRWVFWTLRCTILDNGWQWNDYRCRYIYGTRKAYGKACCSIRKVYRGRECSASASVSMRCDGTV